MLNYQRVSRSYSLVAVSSWPFTKLRFQDLQANKAVRTWATAMSPTTGWSFATGATGATESPTSTAVLANRDRNLMAMAPRWRLGDPRLGDPRLGDPFKNWIRARGVVFQFVVSTCFKQLVNAECFMSLWKNTGLRFQKIQKCFIIPIHIHQDGHFLERTHWDPHSPCTWLSSLRTGT